MRAVIQRVRSASVTVNGEIISSIGRGLMVLVGIGAADKPDDMAYLIGKILSLKLFPSAEPGDVPWKRSVVDVEGEVLCVSQFTLFAKTRRGSKPDFHEAMAAESSKTMYETFLKDLRARYVPNRIFDGQFGAMMDVQIVNDGPVTIVLDSRDGSTPVGPTPKQQRKEELEAAKAAKTQSTALADDGQKLADRWKEAMTEGF